MVSIRDILTQATQQLTAAGVDTAALDSRLLLEAAAGLSREQILLRSDSELDATALARFNAFVARRTQREPVSHILGHKEFWGLDFKVSRDTLTPRPDSETLIEWVIRRFPDRTHPLKLLDLGTGTGCLILALLSEYSQAAGVGIDLSDQALAIASENAQRLGFNERVRFEKGDWTEGLEGSFDLVVSNPPYIEDAEIERLAPEVARYEPMLALSGGGDGMKDYRRIAKGIGRLLKPEGMVAVEIGEGQTNAVSEVFSQAGFERLEVARDLAGIERVLAFKAV